MNINKLHKYLVDADDEVYARYLRIMDSINDSTSVTDYNNEALRLHKTRTIRTLVLKSNINADDLIQASLEDIAYRSRLVEIMVMNGKLQRRLEMALTNTNNHIMVNYADKLATYSPTRTKTDKQQTVDLLLDNGWKKHEAMVKLNETLSQIVDDIDKTGWSLKNLVQLITLVSQRENVIRQATI